MTQLQPQLGPQQQPKRNRLAYVLAATSDAPASECVMCSSEPVEGTPLPYALCFAHFFAYQHCLEQLEVPNYQLGGKALYIAQEATREGAKTRSGGSRRKSIAQSAAQTWGVP